MAVYILSFIWMELKSTAVAQPPLNPTEQNATKRRLSDEKMFPATPGAFPYHVVLLANGSVYEGILTTEDTVLTSCRILTDKVKPAKAEKMIHTRGFTAIGSNGDWQHDPKRQNRTTDFVFISSGCLRIDDENYIDLGAAVLQRPFEKTPYVNAISNRAVFVKSEQWKDLLLKILSNAHCYRMIGTECVRREFEIGGYICSNGSCSTDSPMFRYFTHVLEDRDCLKVICANTDCKRFKKKELHSTGTLCFPTQDIGGPGSPVAYNRILVAIGNFVKDNHLVATRFDIGYVLVGKLFSAASHIFCTRSVLVGMYALYTLIVLATMINPPL